MRADCRWYRRWCGRWPTEGPCLGFFAEMQARLRNQFGTVDVNKNNAIDPAEYGTLVLVKQAGKNAPQMSTFDGNRDGKLGFGEYVKLVQALAPKEPAKAAAK